MHGFWYSIEVRTPAAQEAAWPAAASLIFGRHLGCSGAVRTASSGTESAQAIGLGCLNKDVKDSARFGSSQREGKEPGFPSHHERLDSSTFSQIVVSVQPSSRQRRIFWNWLSAYRMALPVLVLPTYLASSFSHTSKSSRSGTAFASRAAIRSAGLSPTSSLSMV